ncbi:MAG: hypothetical protein GY753_06970 [Gammaproteobacteria bacterium]|nr:hypothetical protein [Gammaproteobacteria bacterium]
MSETYTLTSTEYALLSKWEYERGEALSSIADMLNHGTLKASDVSLSAPEYRHAADGCFAMGREYQNRSESAWTAEVNADAAVEEELYNE